MRERHLIHIERWIDICIYGQAISYQMSLLRHPNRPINGKLHRLWVDFKLVKVISHQSVIIGRFNSTTEFVRLRLRSKGNIRTVGSVLRGISWETSMIFAASLLQSWMTTELNRHLVWSSTASPSKQRRHRWVDPDSCDQQVYYILSTVIHLTSFERWAELWKLNWVRAYKRSSTSIITYLTNNWRLIDVIRFRKAVSPVVFVL